MGKRLQVAFVTLVATTAACSDGTLTDPAADTRDNLSQVLVIEEEIYGTVYVNGTRTYSQDYLVTLEPFGPVTAARLAEDYGSQMTLTSNSRGFGWFDPQDAGGCGNLEAWPDVNSRLDEVHGGSGKETHCVRPGTYILKLWHHGIAIRELRIDYAETNYLALDDSTASGLEDVLVENQTVGASPKSSIVDVEVNFDITTNSFSDNAILDIDVGGSETYSKRFKNDPSPAADDTTLFRFSA